MRFNPKEEAWEKERAEVDATADRLGKRVDAGIKESVIALRALGLSTDASCEGHMEKELKAPWVDIGQVPPELNARLKEATRKGGPIAPGLQTEAREVGTRLLQEQSRVLDLLEEFYRSRAVPLRRRLILKFYPNSARLMSQEAELQALYPPDVQRQKLREFQEEMGAFASFLKDRFFNTL